MDRTALTDQTDAIRLPTHELVYRQVRDQILFGELAPGQPVTIQGLTDTLGVGMTPVREALRRLTAAGALEFLGNRRIVVPMLDAKAVDELTVARKAIEPELAQRAAHGATAPDVERLTAIDKRLDAAIRRRDLYTYLVENHSFHAHINALADAPILTEMVGRLWLRFGPSLRVVCGQISTLNLPDRHRDVINALGAKDGAAAAKAMAGDVVQGMGLIRDGLT